ncbi:MAG: DUF4252 domain-containing protein [Terracidiphilus sp.]|jgi:hypothetical protein
MRNRSLILLLTAGALATAALGQNSLPAPSPIEKDLAARASDVTEVTLGKNMLAFAAKVMNGKDQDEESTRHLIEGLDGIYVREYEFDKEGQFSAEEVDQLRKYFETSEWTPIVKERERKNSESTDVMVKLVNGESHGMFILAVEPKELTIVLILGPINMDELGELRGIGGLNSLGDIAKTEKMKEKENNKAAEKAAEKAKELEKKGGNQ